MPHNEGQLADRMKGYEQAARSAFPKRLPLIVRVDGKAFSKMTAGLKEPGQPFNAGFVEVMDGVARALCEEIQGAQCAYVQSDECSVLVHGYKKFESSPWFDNQCMKIVSVAASVERSAAPVRTSGSMASTARARERSAGRHVRACRPKRCEMRGSGDDAHATTQNAQGMWRVRFCAAVRIQDIKNPAAVASASFETLAMMPLCR